MADVEAVIAPLQREGEVDFRVFYETEIPALIHTDPTRLKQALINLISNALKFTDDGHVFVHLRVDREAADPRLAISVEDTGCGIDSGDLQRIFDIFMQLDGGTSTVPMGMGLGLPLAKWIASQLGGTLEVTSAVDRGSTFTLRVATGPISDVEWVKHEEANASRLAGRTDRPESGSPLAEGELKPAARLRGRVLLAEDVRDLRELISDVLADVGAEVTTVSDGEEAVKTALEGSFDLILMDVYMPKVAGSDATAELRKRGCVTPIIALTASTAPGDRERLLEGGFDDLWTKPISMDRIVDGVADYLDRVADESDPDDHTRPSWGISSARLASAAAEFSRSLPSRLDAVREAIAAKDADRVHNLLHQLVGTAGTLGFMPVSREAARLLSKIKDGSFTNEPDALRPLEERIKTSKS
ncbi:MAG: ATP-binding protein [Planctomycetota bacterium]|jgi:CheY-like chemotaxis protein/anti-sigma regulatory factor (Ser/Thr protein kinase)